MELSSAFQWTFIFINLNAILIVLSTGMLFFYGHFSLIMFFAHILLHSVTPCALVALLPYSIYKPFSHSNSEKKNSNHRILNLFDILSYDNKTIITRQQWRPIAINVCEKNLTCGLQFLNTYDEELSLLTVRLMSSFFFIPFSMLPHPITLIVDLE